MKRLRKLFSHTITSWMSKMQDLWTPTKNHHDDWCKLGNQQTVNKSVKTQMPIRPATRKTMTKQQLIKLVMVAKMSKERRSEYNHPNFWWMNLKQTVKQLQSKNNKRWGSQQSGRRLSFLLFKDYTHLSKNVKYRKKFSRFILCIQEAKISNPTNIHLILLDN